MLEGLDVLWKGEQFSFLFFFFSFLFLSLLDIVQATRVTQVSGGGA